MTLSIYQKNIVYALTLITFLFFTSFYGKKVDCGDLLEQYGEKPPQLTFVGCKEGTEQSRLEATYKVSGTNAQAVELFLREKYGLAPLKFVCCGWEPTNGKTGTIQHSDLAKINPNYILDVSMFGNAERKNEQGEYYIERDRTKVDFMVIVKLLDL